MAAFWLVGGTGVLVSGTRSDSGDRRIKKSSTTRLSATTAPMTTQGQ